MAGHSLTANSRYLRARRFAPQEAFKQFKDTEDWRRENKLSDIFNNIEIEEYEQTRRLVTTRPAVQTRPMADVATVCSTPNGSADATSAASRCICSRSPR